METSVNDPTAPGPRLTHKSDKRRLHPRDYLGLLKQTFNDWVEDKAMRLAAALSLYTILSLAPLLVISVKVASLVLEDEAAQGRVEREVGGIVGSAGGKAIQDMVRASAQPGAGTFAIVISFGMLLFTASGVFAELQDSMNTIWEVKPKPDRTFKDMIRERLFSMAMVFGVVFLLLVSLVVSTALLALARYLGGEGWVSTAIDWVISLVVITAMFAMLFRFVPDVRVEWGDVLLGAFFTAVLFKVGQIGLGLYFNYASPTSAYGAAGSLAAVLLWAYYSSMIFFFGAEFTQVYAHRAGRHALEVQENAVPVTEEERAQQGIPSKENVEAAVAGEPIPPEPGEREARRAPVPVIIKVTRPEGLGWKEWLIGAGGVALGAVVAAFGLRRTGRR